MVFLEFPYTNFLTCEMRAERQEMHGVSLPINGVCFPSPWNQNPGKSRCHLQFFPPLPFVAPSDEHVAPHQTAGEALPLQTLPRSTRGGGGGDDERNTCIYLLVAWQYTFSSFSLSGRHFLFFLLQFCHQPNKRSTDEKYHMFFLGFIPLS